MLRLICALLHASRLHVIVLAILSMSIKIMGLSLSDKIDDGVISGLNRDRKWNQKYPYHVLQMLTGTVE
jgi:hypothetical protein